MALVDKVATLRLQLGLSPELSIKDAVEAAVAQLGLQTKSLSLIEQADACLGVLGSTVQPSMVQPMMVQPSMVQPTMVEEPVVVVMGTAVVVEAEPAKPVTSAPSIAPFDVSAFAGQFMSTHVAWTPVRPEDLKKHRIASIMSVKIDRRLDGSGCWTGRSDAMVRVFGFIQQPFPMHSYSGQGVDLWMTSLDPRKPGKRTHLTITSPTTARGENDGTTQTVTVDPQRGTMEVRVEQDGCLTMRVEYARSVPTPAR